MKLILSTIAVFFLSSLCFAETVVLKSGKTVEGKLIEKTDEYIKIDFLGAPLTYFLDEIESIDGNKLIPPLVTEDKKLSNSSNPSSFSELLDKDVYYAPEGYDIKIKIPKGWHMANKTINADTFNLLGKAMREKEGLEPIVIFLKDSGDEECPVMISLGVRQTRPNITITQRMEHIAGVITQAEKDGESEIIDKPEVMGNGKIIRYSENRGKLYTYQYIFQKGDQLFFVFCDVCPRIINEEYKALFNEIGGSIDSLLN